MKLDRRVAKGALDTDLVNHEIRNTGYGEIFPQDSPRDMIMTKSTMQAIVLHPSTLTKGPQAWDMSRVGTVFSTRRIALSRDVCLSLSSFARALAERVRNAGCG
jgi:hypothetical protein